MIEQLGIPAIFHRPISYVSSETFQRAGDEITFRLTKGFLAKLFFAEIEECPSYVSKVTEKPDFIRLQVCLGSVIGSADQLRCAFRHFLQAPPKGRSWLDESLGIGAGEAVGIGLLNVENRVVAQFRP